MAINLRSSITDIPRNVLEGERDQFGIQPFEDGLINFIENTSTPITIALQGEWGSGKTSLMNSLQQNLSVGENAKFHSIWLNTWEYALMNDAQTTLINILGSLIQETAKVANIDETKTQKMLGKLAKFGKAAGTFAIKTAGNKLADGVGDFVSEQIITKEGKSTVSEIRNDLQKAISSCCSNTEKNNFIFFIDDLDRIDPPVAVELLELLKNIFTLKDCVFVLAIDYDVVIKGLEPKFGKLTDYNEREFRSFFDKIIQVPFSMPVNNYKIDDFLRDSLVNINYINAEQSQKPELINNFTEFANLTVGSNPRALKRMINSLSLISCINAAKSKRQSENNEDDQLHSDLEILINFALVSIQISYPPVYKLLTMYPNFLQWNESVALQMNLHNLDENSIEKLKQNPEFDEDWEQVLFRLCENDPYLKKKALNVSRLLNTIKDAIIAEGESVEDIIGGIISLSSVTNLEAFDKTPQEYHRGELLKSIRNRLIPQLQKELPDIKNKIKPQGARVQTNAYIKFTDKDWEHWVRLFTHPYEGKIRLIIVSAKYMNRLQLGTLEEALKNSGLWEKFQVLEKEYNSFTKKHQGFEQLPLQEEMSRNDNHVQLIPHLYYVLPTVDDFKKAEHISKISAVITELYGFLLRLSDLKKEMDLYSSN